MRVLHIMSGFGGGISSFILNKAIALKEESVVFDVVTYDDCSSEFIDAIQATGGNVYQLHNPKKEGWKTFINSFEDIFQHYHFDVVHCHINGYRAIPYYVIAKKYVDRFYLHAHDSKALHHHSFKEKFKAKINQKINRQLTDAYLGCGALANLSNYGNINLNEQMIIPNSIQPDRFLIEDEMRKNQKDILRKQYNIHSHQIVVGQIGRLKKVKNIEFTLKIAEYVKLHQLPYTFMIAGQGELETSLKQQVKEKKLEEFVTFLGRVEPIEKLMPLFDVMLLPSHYEGLPTVIVEAQAIGIPCILNTTITKEVDFKLGNVSYLSVDAPIEQWVKKIEKITQLAYPSYPQRQRALEKYHFTNELSAKLYLDFLNQNIKYFQLSEER